MDEVTPVGDDIWPSDLVDPSLLESGDEAALDACDIGLIKLDTEGTVVFYNAAEERMASRKREDVLGKSFFKEVAPCTQVPQFEGRFWSGVKRGYLNEHFLFDFDFDFSPATQVAVSLQDTVEKGQRYLWVMSKIARKYDFQADDNSFLDQLTSEIETGDPDQALAPFLAPIDKIQHWAVLLVVDPDTYRIVGCSENEHMLRYSKPTLLGEALSDVLPPRAIDTLATLRPTRRNHSVAATMLRTQVTGNPEQVDIRVTYHRGFLFLESVIAEASNDHDARKELYTLFEINEAFEEANISEICEQLVQNIARVSRYDRVALFRFDATWNSQVTHEVRQTETFSRLKDLYFPESDFPENIRALYRTSAARFVPVRDYAPVKVNYLEEYKRTKENAISAGTSISQETSQSASNESNVDDVIDCHDFSSVQCAAAPVMQRVYLRSLGINGSMNFSIVVNGSLWGLVVAHHPKPLHVTQAQKLLLQMMVQRAATRLENRIVREAAERRNLSRGVHLALVEALNAAENVIEATLSRDNFSLLDLYESHSAGVFMEGNLYMRGEAPPSDAVKQLIKIAAEYAEDGIWHTDQVGSFLPEMAPYQRLASGAIIAFPSKSESYAIVWLFAERVMLRGWAGNPSSSRIITGPNGMRMALPRPSYDRWTEVTCGRSRHITRDMLDMAEEVRQAMGDFLLKRSARLLRMSTDLNAANARMSALIDNMPEAVIGLFRGETIVSFNRGAEQMFKGLARDKIGFSANHLFEPESWERLIARMQLDTSGANIAVDCLRDSGDSFPADLSFGTWMLDGKQMLVMVLRDRTEAVHFEQLAHQKTKTEALGQFAGSVAHDFNNFLSIISANIDLADLTDNEKGRHERLNAARHAVRRGAELTDRLLSLVRRRQSPAKLQELNHIIRENTALFKATLGDRVNLLLSLDNAPIYLKIEPGRVENAIINLLNNSRDAIEGKGEVSILTRMEKRAGEKSFCLEIVDTGHGMSKEIKDRALEPFYSTKAPGKGTGIGLMTLSQLAASLNGRIELDSEPGKGTSFKVLFPPLTARDVAFTDESLESETLQAPSTVLVVEDEVDVREPVVSLLRHQGFDVLEAHNYKTACAKMKEHGTVDILLSDINLSDKKSGFDIGQHAQDKNLAKVILYMTGDQGTIERVDSGNEIPILAKPFRLSSFMRTWREEIERLGQSSKTGRKTKPKSKSKKSEDRGEDKLQ